MSQDQKSLKAIGVDLQDMRSIFQPSLKQFKCKCRLSSHFSGVLGNNNDDSHNHLLNSYYYKPVTKLSALPILFLVFLVNTLELDTIYYLHFTDEDTEN